MTEEEKIKYYFLPYQAHLKLTQIGKYLDNSPMIPDIPPPSGTTWGAFDTTCSYTIPEKTVPNQIQSKVFTKNDCPSGAIPVGTVTYTVPANTYFGYNLDEANLYALKDIEENGQDYANANGSCILILEQLLFTTNGTKSTSNFAIWLNQYTGDIPEDIYLVVKQGSTIIKEEQIIISGAPFSVDLGEDEVEVYIKGNITLFDKIKEISIDGVLANGWGIDNIYPGIFPQLTKLHITGQNNLTSINWTANTELDRLEIQRNGITGNMDTSMLPKLVALEFYGNSVTSISPMSNHPDLIYFNSTENPLTGSIDFTSCTNITTIYANNCNLVGINVTGLTNLKVLGINNNNNLTQSFNFSTNTSLEEFNADNCPLTDIVWNAINTVKVFNISNNTVPQSSIQAGINANKSSLVEFYMQSMPQIVTTLDFDNCPNLTTLWAANLVNCAGISWGNSNALVSINIAGMISLSHTLSLVGKNLNGMLWITGVNITPANLDDLLIYISGLDISPIQTHSAGPGAIIYGDYGGATGAITPTLASLSAYNDLVTRGYTVIGPVPGT